MKKNIETNCFICGEPIKSNKKQYQNLISEIDESFSNKELKKLSDLLFDVMLDTCFDYDTGIFNSKNLDSYADTLRYLKKHRYVDIISESGNKIKAVNRYYWFIEAKSASDKKILSKLKKLSFSPRTSICQSCFNKLKAKGTRATNLISSNASMTR